MLQNIHIYILNFLIIKESWKKIFHGFYKNIKQHNYFQRW